MWSFLDKDFEKELKVEHVNAMMQPCAGKIRFLIGRHVNLKYTPEVSMI
jgi:ribosome-binding factor A